ncbi:hypothetical protein SARC_01301 [Sphaeroforma arctica JP610]|uniref:Uncharacterized protein n=1 Tax=Sphaeroforma arctica JP610 TaxID=667725 RepID=A0A0L0GE42_9EUKA|nr:hypothetical protein SARC_01301 [Sphaeroforma arctica JP610]KNC86528.1 hypothetical protein SARC_01301 [Sphaeroforma arctica JP610]|eukprot:XP_014160430.1 hypothetical protein SARC_01301 [Sphaeroforma arctica JP610]
MTHFVTSPAVLTARMEATPTPAPRATPFSDTSFATPSQTPHSQHLPNSQSRSYMEPLCGMLDVLRRRIGDATTMPGNVTNASQKRVANAAADGAGVDMVDCGVGGRGVEENYMQIEGTTLFAADGSLVGQCGDSVCAEGEAGADTQESFNTQKYLNSYHADFFAGILCLLETYDYSSTTVSLPTASAPASSGTVPTKVSIAPTLSTIGRGRAAHKGASPSAGTSVRGGKQLSTRMKHALYRLLESCCFVVYKTLVAAPALSFPFDTPPTAQANGPQTCANNTHPNNQSRDHGKGAANGTSRDRLQQSGISATLFRINVLIIETIVRMLMVHSEAVYPTTGSGPPSASTASVVWRVLHRTSVCEMDPLYLNREYSYGSIFEPLLSNMNTWIRTKRYPLLIGSCLRLLTTISLFSPGANIMSPLGPISTLSAALDAQIHQYERHSQHPTHSQRDSMQHNQQMSARNPIPDLGSVNGQSEQSMYSLPALANTAIAGLPMKYTGLPVCTFDGPIAYYLQDRRHNQWHTVFCQVLCLYTSMLHTLKARAVGEAVSFLIVHYERLMRCLRRSNDSSGRVVSVAEMEELVAVSAFMAALADAGVFSWKPEIHLSQYRAILDEKMELIPKHVLETVLYYTTLLSKACDYEDTQLVIPVTRSEREQEQTPAPIRLLSARARMCVKI